MSAPTEKMIAYAIAIADTLNIDRPDLYDFESVSRFIGIYSPSYRQYVKQKSFYRDLAAFRQVSTKELSAAFLDKIGNAYQGVSGLYFFFSDMELVYVGKSTNLSERVLASFREKYIFRQDINMVGVMQIQNLADLQMAEPYFISKLKPPMNKEFNVKDYPELFQSNELDAAYGSMVPFFIFEPEDEEL